MSGNINVVQTMVADADYEVEIQKSKTYKMEVDGDNVRGFIDEVEAMKQAIWKVLSTERYRFPIYSWNYGVELEDLFGESKQFVVLELPKRIRGALLQDDRIESVENFEFDTSKKGVVSVTFDVNTIFGVINYMKEVNY